MRDLARLGEQRTPDLLGVVVHKQRRHRSRLAPSLLRYLVTALAHRRQQPRTQAADRRGRHELRQRGRQVGKACKVRQGCQLRRAQRVPSFGAGQQRTHRQRSDLVVQCLALLVGKPRPVRRSPLCLLRSRPKIARDLLPSLASAPTVVADGELPLPVAVGQVRDVDLLGLGLGRLAVGLQLIRQHRHEAGLQLGSKQQLAPGITLFDDFLGPFGPAGRPLRLAATSQQPRVHLPEDRPDRRVRRKALQLPSFEDRNGFVHRQVGVGFTRGLQYELALLAHRRFPRGPGVDQPLQPFLLVSRKTMNGPATSRPGQMLPDRLVQRQASFDVGQHIQQYLFIAPSCFESSGPCGLADPGLDDAELCAARFIHTPYRSRSDLAVYPLLPDPLIPAENRSNSGYLGRPPTWPKSMSDYA